jgi:hypothetical protein
MATEFHSITGKAYDLAQLTQPERAFLDRAFRRLSERATWSTFTSWWIGTFISSGIAEESSVARICEDLQARLGIAEGIVARPDYRDILGDLILEKYGSFYRFCKVTQLVDKGQLSRVLAGQADLSIETLTSVLEILGARLRIDRLKGHDVDFGVEAAVRELQAILAENIPETNEASDGTLAGIPEASPEVVTATSGKGRSPLHAAKVLPICPPQLDRTLHLNLRKYRPCVVPTVCNAFVVLASKLYPKHWDEPELIPFNRRLPRHDRKHPPVIVSLPNVAQLESLNRRRWRGILGMPPQDTEIVVPSNRSIPGGLLGGLRNEQLGLQLGGKRIAVTDYRSVYALRLAALARTWFIPVLGAAGNRSRKGSELVLVPMEPQRMEKALEAGDVDGFACGEPFRTLADLHLGENNLARAWISAEDVSLSTEFCCITVVDDAIASEPELLSNLVDAVLAIATRREDACSYLQQFYAKQFRDARIGRLAFDLVVKHVAKHVEDVFEHDEASALSHDQKSWTHLLAAQLQPEIRSGAIQNEHDLITLLAPAEKETRRRLSKKGQFQQRLMSFYDLEKTRSMLAERIEAKPRFVEDVRSVLRATEKTIQIDKAQMRKRLGGGRE